MANEKTPLYVAFSTQKGGVGKTTFTVLAASYLYYLKGYDGIGMLLDFGDKDNCFSVIYKSKR